MVNYSAEDKVSDGLVDEVASTLSTMNSDERAEMAELLGLTTAPEASTPTPRFLSAWRVSPDTERSP